MKNLQEILMKVPPLPVRSGLAGFSIYMICVAVFFAVLPPLENPDSTKFIFAIGIFALWRYSWGTTHFIRSIIYRKYVFPRWRRQVDTHGASLMPSKIYLLITSFRIDGRITHKSVSAAIEEAIVSGVPTVIVASIVELADELLYKDLFCSYNPPSHVTLKIVRIPGTGKRDALASGFRVISRDMPPEDAVVALIDGDTVLTSGALLKCVPFFKLRPNLGALTTDEIPEVQGSRVMSEWYEMRFAQRQLLMGSISLSKRVMTLTGRMSLFRASIVTNPEFIDTVLNDHLDHWRLGRFKFLTGDDKSSLYWVLKEGYEQIYIPDVAVVTMEEPPSKSFFRTSTKLMMRWYGNMLRTNMRVLKLGPRSMPFFVWWSFLDQRLSMWTALTGPVFAILAGFQHGWIMIWYYLAWIALVRGIIVITLLSARPVLSWRYPFLLYYNQVYGALVKTYILFRLDRQSWTRQKTQMQRELSPWMMHWNSFSSLAMHATALLFFISTIGYMSGVFVLPLTSMRVLF